VFWPEKKKFYSHTLTKELKINVKVCLIFLKITSRQYLKIKKVLKHNDGREENFLNKKIFFLNLLLKNIKTQPTVLSIFCLFSLSYIF
jgi:hypothetical protein